jgi:dTDP-4-dehydrorhamnose reductase
VWTLADALLELVETGAAGLLHVVGPQLISRYTLGVGLLDALGIEMAGRVEAAPAPETQPRRLDLSLNRARTLLRHTPLLTLDEARDAWR